MVFIPILFGLLYLTLAAYNSLEVSFWVTLNFNSIVGKDGVELVTEVGEVYGFYFLSIVWYTPVYA